MQQTYLRPEIEDLGTLADITLGSGHEITDIQALGLAGGFGGSITNGGTTVTFPDLGVHDPK